MPDAVEFTLPDVAEGLADAEVVRWLVAEGGAVTLDEAFIEIETDKAVVDIPAPLTGTLLRHGAAVGEVVKVGALLAVFAPPGADLTGAAAVARTDAPPRGAATDHPATQHADTPNLTAGGRKPRATPATRRLARELGVDLAAIAPSGDTGRILDADVCAHADGGAPGTAQASEAATGPVSGGRPAVDPAPEPATPQNPTAAPGRSGGPTAVPTPAAFAAATAVLGEGDREVVPMRGLRRATARTMAQSWTTVPHVSSFHEVDVGALQDLRAQLKAGGHPVPLTAFMVRAAALALRDFPTLNATVDAEREELVLLHRRHIGVAVDAPDGLIVPVIPDADRKGVRRIGAELRALADAAVTRSLTPAQLQGATFTVNNFGSMGAWFGTSLVKPPEVAICSFGAVRDQVVPRDGEVVIRPLVVLALGADHRAGDGRELIGFCMAVRERLEHPLTLLVEE